MMKKIIFVLTSLIVLIFAASAELADSHRFFEIGMEAEGGASNNYFRARDMLVKEIVINLEELGHNIPEDGFILDCEGKVRTYIALDYSKNFRMNFFYGVSGAGYGSISKNLFKILEKGISVNTNETFTTDIYAEMFLDAGFSYKTDINGWGVRVSPAFFTPLFHISETNGYAKYVSTENGLIRGKADIPVNIYSAVNLEGIKDKTVNFNYIEDIISEVSKAAGFDLGLEVERNLTRTFDAGIFTAIPLIPGRIKYKASTRYWGIIEQKNLFGKLNETESFTKDYGHDEMTYSQETILVNRPFRLGAEGAWRPFGDWCIMRPKLCFVVTNPFSGEHREFWEYSFNADFVLLNVLGLKFGTAYENRVFKQTAGFMINTRIMELNVAAQLRGADFGNSFNETGASGIISIKFGF